MRVRVGTLLLFGALAAIAGAGAACDRGSGEYPAKPPPPPPPPPASVSASAVPAKSAAAPDAAAPAPQSSAIKGRGPGFPVAKPWVSFYGSAAQMGDVAKVAATYRVINIDADPGSGNFTDAHLKTLKAAGKNKVISYLNVGSCELYREYWSKAPPGFVGCGPNRAAHLGSYEGYPDETWMDPSNPDYRKLIVEHVAARLAARGVDGFYLDNLELLGHGEKTKNGPCNARCVQGGLDLVRALREKFPDLLIVMQNGTTDVTRLGTTGGVPFPSLLDGIAHEEVYAPKVDAEAEKELLAWKAMPFESKNGHPLWIAIEDYVGSCKNVAAARAAMAKAASNGFSSYVSDESGGQKVVCYW
jgi:cysteinyl-tRNA synthetase, unknown class